LVRPLKPLGNRHKNNNPAGGTKMKQGKIADTKGTIRYYKDGLLHRDGDLPAVEHINGDKYWYQNGKLYRDNDQPAEVYANGDKAWFQNSKLHRDNDQPAVEQANGIKAWFQNSKLHRLTGPAWTNSNGIEEYWINGERLTKEEHANHPEVKKYRLQQALNRLTA
jgi:hypothetical protein